MSKHRYTRGQKIQMMKDYDSKRYTKEDFLKKYDITLQNLYSWRNQLKKRATKRSQQQILAIVNESERIGIPAVCEKHGLKSSTVYAWRSKYLSNKQVAEITVPKMQSKTAQTEIDNELTKYKDMCLQLLSENITLKRMIEKMNGLPTIHRSY